MSEPTSRQQPSYSNPVCKLFCEQRDGGGACFCVLLRIVDVTPGEGASSKESNMVVIRRKDFEGNSNTWRGSFLGSRFARAGSNFNPRREQQSP